MSFMYYRLLVGKGCPNSILGRVYFGNKCYLDHICPGRYIKLFVRKLKNQPYL